MGPKKRGGSPARSEGGGSSRSQVGPGLLARTDSHPQKLLKAALTNSKKLKADTARDSRDNSRDSRDSRDNTMSDVTNRTHNVTGLDSR